MKEYLVHIEIEDKDHSHNLIFRSSALAVLFLAIDDERNAISNVDVSDSSTTTDAQWTLQSMTNDFDRQLTTVDEQDQLNEPEEASSIIRQEPLLKISYPGAE